MLKPIFLIVIVLVTIQNIFAQHEPVKRYELDLHQQYSHCGTVALGEKGVFFYCKNSKPTKTDFVWKLTVLDTNLSEVIVADLAVNKNFTLESITNDKDFVYFVFKKGAKSLQIFRINTATLTAENIQVEMDKVIYDLQLTFHGDKTFMSLNTNTATFVLACDFITKEIVKREISLGSHISNRIAVQNLKVDPITEELVVNIEISNEFERALKVYFYDLNLTPLDLFDPGLFTNYFVQSFQVKALQKDVYMYTGTYSLTKDDPTEGIFCIGITDRDTVFLEQFITLTNLEAFKRYLNESGEETRELRKAKQNLITAIHEVYESDNRYFLVAEFYGPTYRTSAGATIFFGLAGAAVSVKFDGFLYKGADLVAIEDDGQVAWDILLNVHPAMKPLKEKLLVNVESTSNKIELNFPAGMLNKTMKFDEKGNILDQKNQTIYQLNTENKFVPWYDGVYIHSGYFDKYIVFNAESITDRVTVKHNAFFIEKYSVNSK